MALLFFGADAVPALAQVARVGPNEASNVSVRYWPLADIEVCTAHVCF